MVTALESYGARCSKAKSKSFALVVAPLVEIVALDCCVLLTVSASTFSQKFDDAIPFTSIANTEMKYTELLMCAVKEVTPLGIDGQKKTLNLS